MCLYIHSLFSQLLTKIPITWFDDTKVGNIRVMMLVIESIIRYADLLPVLQ